MSPADRLIDQIDRALGGEHKPDKVGVAVSGGSDSLALLHLLHEWGQVPLVAATVDHGLRAEAAAEALAVSDICSGLNISHNTLTWRGWDGKGNLQDQARRNRFSILADWAKENSCQTVCLGHTMDDQAETFLMRLSRASGLDALAGMDRRIWRHEQRFDRPLLSVRRKDLQSYLSSKGLGWIDDPSNQDKRFDRVRARQAMAQLEEFGLTPDNVTRSMANLSLAGLELRERSREIAGKICKEVYGDVIFDRTAFRNLNSNMQYRLFSKALMFVSSELYPPRREAMHDALAAMIEEKTHTLHGCCILSSGMALRITRECKAVEHLTGLTDALWDARWKMSGPHDKALKIRALGEAVKDTPWRETVMPRQSLLASPAVWRGETLIAAPVAGLANGWTAEATGRGKFTDFLLRR